MLEDDAIDGLAMVSWCGTLWHDFIGVLQDLSMRGAVSMKAPCIVASAAAAAVAAECRSGDRRAQAPSNMRQYTVQLVPLDR
jgi:hypothetical protein